MIQQLHIKNFKSIKDLKFPCKKLNVFIGEPNSGKSNIIEALALHSDNVFDSKEFNKQIFRYKTIGDLFYDFNTNNRIEIITNDITIVLKYSTREDGVIDNKFQFFTNYEKLREQPNIITYEGLFEIKRKLDSTNVRYYEYKRLSEFSKIYFSYLSAPYGDNLVSLLLANTEYKKWVSEFLKSKGLMLTLKPTENDMLASKLVEDEIYSYPYFSLSETLQRIIFYTIAIKSNKNSTILFDEPETNTFPLYTKLLAERIALDETNQFFVTTHNPYLLENLIEKSKTNDINVCIVEMKDYQTKLTVLNEKQVSQVLDLNSDVFFNFDKILAK